MHLVGHPDNPRLITIRTGIDHTDRMKKWMAGKLPELEKEDLCGFIFKTRSPSSGMKDVKIYTKQGQPSRKGAGIFARGFMERFPDVPVEDEGRLHDAGIRENFIERVFVYHRWKMLLKQGMRMRYLVDFHTDHKLLIMSHSPKLLRELGKYVAQKQGKDSSLLFFSYFRTLMEALRLKATVKKHVNVLYHMMGYFKKVLSPEEKQELIEIIEHYHRGLLPLIVPITLINHYVRKYDEPYLRRQVYLHPHPVELMLRNHV